MREENDCQRWLRIIPVALIMYTISYVDRTNVSLALDPQISSMMRDLLMDDKLKGEAAGTFFLGYLLLQLPGGYWAHRWSARKLISLCLVFWGLCAAGCGLAQTFRQFEAMRFMLGVAESAVFPATLVLLANWFPRAERARANAYWTLCQPLAVAGSAPLTAWLLGVCGWRQMLIFEGLLPFVWLPVWWFCIRDRPQEAGWIGAEERRFLETTIEREAAELESPDGARPRAQPPRERTGPAVGPGPGGGRDEIAAPHDGRNPKQAFAVVLVLVLVAMYFLQNCAAYGCMTFFTASLGGRGFNHWEYGVLFAIPYAVTAVVMVLLSRHSDKTRERRGHVALAYGLSGGALLAAVLCQRWFWPAYGFLCLAIPGPFAAMGPFWSIPTETLPRRWAGLAVGVVNAFGNLGGFVGPLIAGWLKQEYRSLGFAFGALGAGMLVAAALAFLLPRAQRVE
jgi:MFS family permease